MIETINKAKVRYNIENLSILYLDCGSQYAATEYKSVVGNRKFSWDEFVINPKIK